VPNNVDFLRALVADARFKAGNTTTRFLETFHYTPAVAQVLHPGKIGQSGADAPTCTGQQPHDSA
jgi:urea carboxylase